MSADPTEKRLNLTKAEFGRAFKNETNTELSTVLRASSMGGGELKLVSLECMLNCSVLSSFFPVELFELRSFCSQ